MSSMDFSFVGQGGEDFEEQNGTGAGNMIVLVLISSSCFLEGFSQGGKACEDGTNTTPTLDPGYFENNLILYITMCFLDQGW